MPLTYLDRNHLVYPPSNGVDLDDTLLTFGCYKGRAPSDIANDDPAYIVWLYDKIEPKRCTSELYELCEQEVAEGEEDDDEIRAVDEHFGLNGWGG